MRSARRRPAIEISYSFVFGSLVPYKLDIELRIQDSHRKPIINLETLSQDQSLTIQSNHFTIINVTYKQSGAGVVSYYVSPPPKKTRFQKLEDVLSMNWL
jgi:hypothetical protein